MSKHNPHRPSSVWHPYTQMKTMSEPLRVRSGKGVMLELEDGRRLMDCISSWWVTLHGHAQPEIANAIYQQALQLEQVICAGLTHEPAERLAQRLIHFLPEGLAYVFYSDDGSTSVEVGLKMAFQYWKNQNVPGRTRFLSFEGAYHGDTLGAMSVGHRSVFTDSFKEMMFDVDFLPYPETFMDDPDIVEKESNALSILDILLEQKGKTYAALIVEPLVQGAGGMRMCRPEFLSSLQNRLKQHDILMIYDEVMVGFGRTGDFFACQKSKTQPDILCLAKGLTGGFLPLAATICTEKIFRSFYDDDPNKTFYHGHSYTANPLGCAAGLASLDLLEQNKVRFMRMETWHQKGLDLLKDCSRLDKFRYCGTISAMDVDAKKDRGYLSSIGPKLKEKFLEKGFLLRPLGNVIYILPPYCITEDELFSIYECIQDVILNMDI
jgi:adenosylmethionine---8-amino-7-oxononanoate aminotransferase